MDREASYRLAAELVGHLPGWSVRPQGDDDRRDWADLQHTTGAIVALQVYQGRVHALAIDRTEYRARFYGDRGPRATCALDRGAEAIARDLKRRLLPDALLRWDEQGRQVGRHRQHEDEAGLVARRLATIVGGSSEAARRYTPGEELVVYSPEVDAVGRIVVRAASVDREDAYPCRVSFEVHGLDPETAAVVLETIADAQRRRSGAEKESVVADDDHGEEEEEDADEEDEAKRRVV